MNKTDMKILIVGAGGIGSWMIPELYELIELEQIPNNIKFTIADFDLVESKNLLYQNFQKTDLFEPKALVLSAKYNMEPLIKKIDNKSMLNNYDCIVSAVDNTEFRKLLFDYVFNDNQDVYWIDLRSEGKSYAVYAKSKKLSYEYMMNTLPKEDVSGGSCQHNWELENNIIQRGNRHAAQYGVSYLLNWFRGDPNPAEFIHTL